MGENEEKRDKGFKVADKRRFDAEGNEKKDSDIQSSEEFILKDSKGGQADEEIDFSSFIMSLATQGMMQLGEVPAPPGVSIPTDLGLAKQTIEILSMLRIKTKDNLDTFEDQLFEEILHNIRMMYVKKSAAQA